MSTTIDSLDIQIVTNAGNSAVKIEELATAMGHLKNNAKITVAVNGLQKLANTLYSLQPAIHKLDTRRLNELATSVAGLAGIQKLSGLNSALNTLQKIPAIVAGMDSANLAKFATQMQSLSAALAPMATQIEKIGTGFAKLPAKLTQAVSATNKMVTATDRATVATRKHSAALDVQGINIMAGISNFMSMIHVVQMVGNALTATMAQAMEWDGIQYRFGRAFGEDAEEVLAYVEKVNDALGINVQQFMQYSSLYGSLLQGFGLQQDKVTTISIGLTELSYDIWAAYNDRYKTLEDASEAVRSAITGEIEPIRNAGIALTEASLQEYLDQVGMAEISIEKLSEAQKAEVRYAAMMEAAMNQGIVGTYASEMHTAEGAVRNLSQAFKGLVQAFGSLFIPILQIAIPYLTAFINLLYDAIAAIAAFFGIAFFEIDWGTGASDMASGLEDAAASANGVGSGLGSAAKAAKKIKDYTMGFDELNVISPPQESGSGGGGGGGAGSGVDWEGLDLDTLWDESIFKKASKQVAELEQKIKDWFAEWKTELAIIGVALGALSMANILSHLGEALHLGEKFLGVMGTIKKLAGTAIVIVLQYSLMTEFFKSYIDGEGFKKYVAALFVGAIGTGILYSMWGPAGLVIGLSVIAAASLSAVIDNGGITNVESAVVALSGLASAAGAVALAWKKLGPAIVGSNLVQVLIGIKNGSAAASSALVFMFPTLSKIWVALSGAAKAVGAFVAGITAPAWAAIAAVIAAIASVALFLARNWDEVVAATKKFFKEKIAPKLEEIKKHWEKVVDAIRPFLDLIKPAINWVKELSAKFVEWWKTVDPLKMALGALGKVFETIGGIIFGVASSVIAGAFNMLIGIIENFVQVFSGIVQVVSGVIELVVALFTGGDIEAAWQKIWDGVVDVVTGMLELVFKPVVDLVDGVIAFFTDLWDVLVGHSIVPDTVDAIVEWFCSLPEKIFSPIQAFVDGIIKIFEYFGIDIKGWYDTKIAPKLTRAYWQNVFSKAVSGVSSKLSELKGVFAEKIQGVIDWYNTNVAPKLKLSYWKDKVSPFLDVGREIVENIKSGLKEKWDELKKWWEDLELPEFKIKKPHLSWGSKEATGWIADTLSALGMPTKIPDLKVDWYAQGGFPGMGDLFVAREAGPELVGRIGNRSAVANNDQIVAAVSQGVYSAVVAAMSSGGSNSGQNINVYLDGKQIYASVKKTEAERGVSIMGNQLGYAY